MSTVFTFPGKMGDALHQWPIAHHWHKQTGKPFQVWLDEKTCKPLVNLFSMQPGVELVKLVEGVESYNCGGQPFHLNLPTSAFDEHTIYHLGLRGFPVRQLTLECLQTSRVPVTLSAETLATERSLVTASDDAPKPGVRMLVLHGQPAYAHTGTTPTFWKFLAGIRREIDDLFDGVIFVGAPRDLEVAERTYPDWRRFDDEGDLLRTANIVAHADCMMGCGSAPIVLAGLLRVPAIRVHDPIGKDAPKVIWSNLGEDQLNATEIELRKEWPLFRERWLSFPERGQKMPLAEDVAGA